MPPPPVRIPSNGSSALGSLGSSERLSEGRARGLGSIDEGASDDSDHSSEAAGRPAVSLEALAAKHAPDGDGARSSLSAPRDSLGGGSHVGGGSHRAPGGRRSSSRRGSIPELLAEIGLGAPSPCSSPQPGGGDSAAGSSSGGFASGFARLGAAPSDEPAARSVRGGASAARKGDSTRSDDSSEGASPSPPRRAVRRSVAVGKGSASMYNDSMRRQAVQAYRTSSRGGQEIVEEVEEVDDGDDDEEEPPPPPPTGLLVPMAELVDALGGGRNGGGSSRGFNGLLEGGASISLDRLICALTSAAWTGVVPSLAFEPPPEGWALPEYHTLVSSFLASYKPYVSPDALLVHLTTLYTQLAADAERLNLPTAAARTNLTVRERVLYVLLLWVRVHPDDFDAHAQPSHGHTHGPSRQQTLTTFVRDARTVLNDDDDGDGRSGWPHSPNPGQHTELGRYLDALHALFDGGGLSSRRSLAGGKKRASSTATCSTRDSSATLESALGVGSPHEDSSRSGRGRALTASSGSGGARDKRGRSITSGSHEFGINYWDRLLEASASSERAFVRELAEQLALHEAALLRGVAPHELQGLAFAKATKAERAPNVLRLISHFNRMSRWVCTQVVRQPTTRERARCLRLFIELANACRELGNFNGVMEIVAAINSSALFRLKRTWEVLPRASRKDFDELGELVRPDKSHAALRHAMRLAAKRAAVPYLGLYLTDLTFIEDGNKDWVADDEGGGGARLVNLAKCMMVRRACACARARACACACACALKPAPPAVEALSVASAAIARQVS